MDPTAAAADRLARTLWALLALPLLAAPLRAQALAPRTARSVRVEAPPVIDGRLDDPAWALAVPLGEFVQVDPIEGGPPSEATEVRIVHDRDHLYIGIRCFDSDPSAILATQPQRDANLDPDDRVEILLDTFHDGRNAYWFQMNAAGSLGDALITDNGADFNKPWDGIWRGQSSVDELGWIMELAIPFKTVAFDPESDTWGLNFARYVRRKNELNRWSGATRDYGLFVVASAGDLTGLSGLRQGLGLDVVPFLKGSWIAEDLPAGDRQARIVEPGFDAFYRVTPNLTAALTWNTDFAETEVDERRINLTRFPLFFPERRDFFLQDAGLFGFADLGNDLIPFFSRRIGLADGGEVPIDVGAKLTGRAGDWNIGALDVRTGDRTALAGQNLFVSRVSRNVGDDMTLGGIVTDGDPAGEGDNTVVGFDANLRSTTLLDGERINASVWGLKSDSEGVRGDDAAYGVSVSYPNDPWRWELRAKEIQEDFEPALGFVPRRGIRKVTGNLSFGPRSPIDGLRRTLHRVEGLLITDVHGRTQSSEAEIRPLQLDWDSGDQLFVEADTVREVLDEPFEITDEVTIPAGDYTFDRALVQLRTSDHRAVSGRLTVQTGGFFDGRRHDTTVRLDWRPSAGFTGGLTWQESRIALPGGSFSTEIGRLRANWYFGPDVAFTNFIQWDNVSDVLSLATRARWIVEPGRELVLAFDRAWERDDGSSSPVETKATVKGTYTLRF